MEHPQTPPLQRHPSLQPFSRDHYVGLKQSQRLLNAAGSDNVRCSATVTEFLEAWDREIEDHFADEERLLLPLIGEQDASRLVREHTQLREFAVRARELRKRTDPDPGWMRMLGQLLNDHIRWEERELFPWIQRTIGATELEEIGHETEAIERKRRGVKKNK